MNRMINFYEDENTFYIEINDKISRIDLLKKLKNKINENILNDLLFIDENLICNDKIVIYKEDNYIFQKNKGFYSFFSYDNVELFVDHKNRSFVIQIDNMFYNGDNLNDDELHEIYPYINNLLNKLLEYDKTNKLIYYIDSVYTDMGFYNESRFKLIVFDDVLSLALHYFYEESYDWMNLNIINNYTNKIIGYIEFNLSNIDNFKYNGNVSYLIKEKFRNKGYATRALRLLKDYIKKIPNEYDKTLYIATEKSNVFSQKVAINNGGVLVYDGIVPKNDNLYILGKIKEIKIYKVLYL